MSDLVNVAEAVLRSSPDLIVRFDLELRRVYANPRFEELTGLKPEHYLGRRPSEASPIGALALPLEQCLRAALATGRLQELDIEWRAADGRALWHGVRVAVERDAAGLPRGLLMVATDITARKRAESALAAREREFRSLAECSPDTIVLFDADARLVYANPVLTRRLNAPVDKLLGRLPQQLLPPGNEAALAAYECVVLRVLERGKPDEMELRLRGESGRFEVHQARIVPVRTDDGRVEGALSISRDITLGVEQRERIRALALTDPLTRLHNRQALYESVPEMIHQALAAGRGLGVLILDLDRFKDVNDSLGHAAGDELLRALAQRFVQCVRAGDLLVRLGGDEFAVIVGNVEHPSALAAVAGKLLEAVRQPVPLGGRTVVPGGSIGIALCPADGTTLDALLAHADIAMYQAKRGGGLRHAFYRAEFSLRAHERLALAQALAEAQHGAGLELMYQPVVSLSEGRIVGAEALLRWRHPELGLLAPERFVPLAEETGLIVPIGRWVLEQVALAARRWNAGRAEPLRVTLNVSTRQFLDDDLPSLVEYTLASSGCRGEWLGIEVTESLLLEDSDRVQHALAALRALGLQVAIDDFGTGYSALGYLASFDVDRLKFDRCFISRIDADPRQAELVKAFVAVARALRLEVVAEGVETTAQARQLLALGCTLAQGFLFQAPVPATQLEVWLHECHDEAAPSFA
ncbi:EAL domain-containing protein [Aquincola sp. S2]|uniref:EAL domain-containing protein n=1 Tax=Pseudaquabacterium terrae TaxID=2732868 RepID=A0ABX2EGK1_9BURK|nr:bifunctional diguanylate cyclase/phosphodiesterase [Aquabacterium terrae]NRF67735.1 EAL domain-containing protein [Aquabacterium terrae]